MTVELNQNSDVRTVWMLNHYAQTPSGLGGHTRHFSLAKYLKPHGWQAVILAAQAPDSGSSKQAMVAGYKRLEMAGDTMFLWLKIPAKNDDSLGRLLNMLGFMWQALRSKNTNMLPRPHAIIGSTKHPFAALAGRILAKRYQVPFLYEVRDLWSQGLLETGRISRYNPLLAVFKWIEKGCIKSSARILTIAPLLRNYFTERGVAPEQISWLQNGIDLQLSPALPPKNDTDVFTYMYFGAHNFDNSLDNILRAMQILESRVDAAEINLRLIGAGARKAELVKLAYSLGLKRVNFEDAVAKLDVPKLATQADAFVFSVVDSEATNKYGLSPNKLFDFMASGRPILYASSAQNNPVADADAGLCISSSSPENLAQAMLDLANMPLAERQAMGRRGRAYIEENHSLNAVAAKLADILNKVSSGA